MDDNTYQQIYNALNTKEDIKKISEEFSQIDSTIASILHQKTIRHVKKNHHRIKQEKTRLLTLWQKGHTIVQIAKNYNFPPTLTASLLLQEKGYNKKETKKLLNNPDLLSDRKLREQIIDALTEDWCFSPRAHQIQHEKGRLGEQIIHQWLTEQNVQFQTEKELIKKKSPKTPDFLLLQPLKINNTTIHWIESKSIFCDETEYTRQYNKQLHPYNEYFGCGMVVYWYGSINTLVPEGHIITDYRFFEQFNKTHQLIQFTI